MTIETQTNRVQYVGNSLATDFPVPFPVFRPEHLRLFLWRDGRQSEMIDGFMVLGAGTAQVTVRTQAPVPSGVRLTIIRQVPLVQPMDLINGGAFNAEILEGSDDNLEMQIQQLKEEIDRAIKVPIGSNQDPDEMWLKFWAAYLETLKSRDEVLAALRLMIESGFALRPATTSSLGGVIIGDGLAVEATGRVSVDFSQMPTDKFEAMLRQLRLPIWLTRITNFYVNADTGNDSNNGLTWGTAFKTLQRAIDYVTDNFNISLYRAQIYLAPGIYEPATLKPYATAGGIIRIYGDTPQNTKIKSVDGICLNTGVNCGTYHIYNLTLECTSAVAAGIHTCMFANRGAIISLINVTLIHNTIVTGPSHSCLRASGGEITISTDCHFILNGPSTGTTRAVCWDCFGAGSGIFMGSNTTINGTGAYVCFVRQLGQVRRVAVSSVITGDFEGGRFLVENIGLIATAGGGPNFFPGTTAGVERTGGVFT